MYYKYNKKYNNESINFSCDSIDKIYKTNLYKKYGNLIKNKRIYKDFDTYNCLDEELNDSGYCSSNSEASNDKKIYKTRTFYRSKKCLNYIKIIFNKKKKNA